MTPDAVSATVERPAGLLVVTVDRLPAWMLPAYGATWVATPAIDSLAARGIVLDRLITPAVEPAAVLRDLAGMADPQGPSLASAAAARGWKPALVTDDPAVAAWFAAAIDADVTVVAASAGAAEAAVDEETSLARLAKVALEIIRSGGRRLVWCHVASLGVAWDAPRRHRDRYVDPDDPPPPPGARVPSFPVDAGTDPDALVGVRQVFAGQLSLFDAEIGRLFTAVRADAAGAGAWSVLLAGVRGMPLGLHGWVGAGGPEAAYGELVHVPAILVDSSGRMAAQRYAGLVVPADLGATLAELVGGGGPRCAAADPVAPWRGMSLAGLFEDWSAPSRDRVVIGGQQGAVVTPSWHGLLTRDDRDSETSVRLRVFAKPDDFFELTDVADRCPTVAERLAELLTRAAAGDRLAAWLEPLAEAGPE